MLVKAILVIRLLACQFGQVVVLVDKKLDAFIQVLYALILQLELLQILLFLVICED